MKTAEIETKREHETFFTISYRLHCRAACFYIFLAFNHMVKGGYLSDAVAPLGSLNIVAGELEK